MFDSFSPEEFEKLDAETKLNLFQAQTSARRALEQLSSAERFEVLEKKIDFLHKKILYLTEWASKI